MNPGVVGAVFGALAVITGAFGAHGLRERLTPEDLATWEVAVKYQMYHALALMAVAALKAAGLQIGGSTAWLFVSGIVIFSGTVYALALGGPRWLGAVTPIGGLLLILGWVTLAWSLRGS